MSTDRRIEGDVRDALIMDPRIANPDQIVVSVNAGTVTLRGTIGTFSQRRAAVDDAMRIEGVYAVDDQLDVGPPNESVAEEAPGQ